MAVRRGMEAEEWGRSSTVRVQWEEKNQGWKKERIRECGVQGGEVDSVAWALELAQEEGG